MADTRDKDLVEKETALVAEIESLLPDFARSCRGSEDVVIIHRDSVAADYQNEEYTLFGKALKFAGIYGKEVRVIRKNRETLASAKPAYRPFSSGSPFFPCVDVNVNLSSADEWPCPQRNCLDSGSPRPLG
jgi:hypothetical protein